MLLSWLHFVACCPAAFTQYNTTKASTTAPGTSTSNSSSAQGLQAWVSSVQRHHRSPASLFLYCCSSLSISHQSVNQLSNQPINQPVSQSVSQSINQAIDQPTDQSTNHSTNRPANKPMNYLSIALFRGDQLQVAGQYLEFLVSQDRFEEAAALMPRLLKVPVAACFLFAAHCYQS